MMLFTERQLEQVASKFKYYVEEDVDAYGLFWRATDDRGKTMKPLRRYGTSYDALCDCVIQIGDLILCDYFYGREIAPNDKLIALQVYYQSQGYE